MEAGPILPQWPYFLLTLLPPPSSTSSHLFICCLYSRIAQTPYISCLLGWRQCIQSPTPNSCDSVAVSTTQQACRCQCAQISPCSNSSHGVSCLLQIPTVVGESRSLCSVESATRSCFQGVSAMHMSLGMGDRYRLLTNLHYRTITPHSTPGNRMEQVDLPVTVHAMNFDSRAHRTRTRTRKDEENIHLIYIKWRPKSLLKTHHSVPLFFRCWAQQSKRRNSSLGCSLSLPSSCGSRPATDCQPLRWPRTLLGVESAGTSQSQDWGTVTHQPHTDNSVRSKSFPKSVRSWSCVSPDSLVVSSDTSETRLIWGSQYFPHEGSWLI